MPRVGILKKLMTGVLCSEPLINQFRLHDNYVGLMMAMMIMWVIMMLAIMFGDDENVADDSEGNDHVCNDSNGNDMLALMKMIMTLGMILAVIMLVMIMVMIMSVMMTILVTIMLVMVIMVMIILVVILR